ncbi:MAG TPA: SH3 domain-containing protein [Candidatus Saccharimonadales bacterium]|jgi:hypothetical protein|nr:SH3 domain-containing protein [Candidatus Saccharimonadales bacterium]
MREQEGKFILFDVAEFATFLSTLQTSRQVLLVQNHHTFIPSYSDFNGGNHFARLAAMEAAHLQRGFNEIAQNLTTFPDGTVAVCRPFDIAPAGIKGANSNGLCIENLGNFDAGHDVMTGPQRDCIIRVNALLCQRFGLMPGSNSIVFHHWYDLTTGQRTNGTGTTKTCPGTGFFGGNSVGSAEANFIPLISRELANLPQAGATPGPEVLFNAEVIADSLNVRSEPNATSPILAALARGAGVQVFEERDGWERIDPIESHWVKGSFLRKT